jgi:hypothetical protein
MKSQKPTREHFKHSEDCECKTCSFKQGQLSQKEKDIKILENWYIFWRLKEDISDECWEELEAQIQGGKEC